MKALLRIATSMYLAASEQNGHCPGSSQCFVMDESLQCDKNLIISSRPHSTCQAADSTSEQAEMTAICCISLKCIRVKLVYQKVSCGLTVIMSKGIEFVLKPHCEVTTWTMTLPTPYRVRSNNTAALVVAPVRLSFAFTSPIKLKTSKKHTWHGGI